jgi:hypothetical protein
MANYLMCAQVLAQGNWAYGNLPSVNLTYKLKGRNSLNFATQQRFGMLSSVDQELKYRYILSDCSLLYAHKIGVASKLSVGSLVRFRDGKWAVRTIEQLVFFNTYNQFKFSHRLRLDQTSGDAIVHRLRYRLGMQIPLNGAVLDRKEAYIKLNNELLNILVNGEFSAEYRCSPNYGYVVSDQLKLELGIDYRLSNLTEVSKNQNLWLLIGVYYKLN